MNKKTLFPDDQPNDLHQPRKNWVEGAGQFLGKVPHEGKPSERQSPSTAVKQFAKPGSAKISDLSNARSPEDDLRNFMRAYGKVGALKFNREVSEKTVTNRRVVLWAIFCMLRDNVNGFTSFAQLTPKRIVKILSLWSAPREDGNMRLSYDTQVQNFSVLTWFWRMNSISVAPIKEYITDPAIKKLYFRSGVADQDKSWSANNVDFASAVEDARRIDPVIARLLEMGRAFGMRLNETLRITPHEDDRGDHLHLNKGTKTGRPRDIDYAAFKNMEELRATIDSVKSQLTPGQHAAWQNRTLKQAKERAYYVFKKMGITKKGAGVTFHGLRAQFAIDQFESLTGELTPIRGGRHVDYKKFSDIRMTIARSLGHNRIRVTCAYYGSFFKMKGVESNRFDKSWNLLKPCVESIKKVLDRHGIKNIWWVGDRSAGQNRGLSDIWEFIVDDAVTAEQFDALAKDLVPAVEEELGYGLFLRHTLRAPLESKERWSEQAMPLFEVEPPLMLSPTRN